MHEEALERKFQLREKEDPGSINEVIIAVKKRQGRGDSLATWHKDGLMSFCQIRDQAVNYCNQELEKHNQNRGDWPVSRELRKEYAKSYTWHCIEEEVQHFHRQATAQALMSQLPAGDSRPQTFTLQTFHPENLEEESQSRFWNYEKAQAHGLGLEQKLESVPLHAFLDNLVILKGINAYFRNERAKEEQEFLKHEWYRLDHIKTLLIETILTAENTLGCHIDLLHQELRSSLLQYIANALEALLSFCRARASIKESLELKGDNIVRDESNNEIDLEVQAKFMGDLEEET
ncbi:uncharacterized protein K444DRAFT_638517 [Hyaloscypha bicolor E]|uniref:Uncharacterized protein n=1 Tax=Hyaloscypha bicolor E TaxID=1095630 RepID=A0A2J6SGQ0_9HELO|nr:uncharacterized protein K444DRAFT_638517 [Hyaloscypha bicolor E]PMD49938.1 hypothetical protein K444DRAFT_638517 [Hyaloscypha bicolor E]